MIVNKAAEDAFGTLGTICWTIQLLPQIWKSYRDKSTEGLSQWLMLIWSLSSATFGIYAVVQGLSVPLILQQDAFMLLALISWAQCQYYGRGFSKLKTITILLTVITLFTGFQVGMVYAIRPAYRAGNTRPTQFFGIFTIVLSNSAMIPQFYEIWKHKKVIGISLSFLTVDLMGGVFNDLSLVFKEFDIVAGISYSLVVATDTTIIILSFILNPIADRKAAKMAEKADLESAGRDIEADTKDPEPIVKAHDADGSDSERRSLESESHSTDTKTSPELELDGKKLLVLPNLSIESGLGMDSALMQHSMLLLENDTAVGVNETPRASEKNGHTSAVNSVPNARDADGRILLFRPLSHKSQVSIMSE